MGFVNQSDISGPWNIPVIEAMTIDRIKGLKPEQFDQ